MQADVTLSTTPALQVEPGQSSLSSGLNLFGDISLCVIAAAGAVAAVVGAIGVFGILTSLCMALPLVVKVVVLVVGVGICTAALFIRDRFIVRTLAETPNEECDVVAQIGTLETSNATLERMNATILEQTRQIQAIVPMIERLHEGQANRTAALDAESDSPLVPGLRASVDGVLRI